MEVKETQVRPMGIWGLFWHFVLHPLRLIIRNSSVLIVFFVVLLFNFLTQQHDIKPATQMGGWAFEALPELLLVLMQSPTTLGLVFLLFVTKTVLGVFVAQEMMSIYQRERRGLVDSIKKVRLYNIAWFIGAEIAIYILFGLIALAFYLPAYWAWHTHNLDFTAALFGAFLLLYPAFYICLSTTSMVAVMPLNNQKRIEKLCYLVTVGGAVKMWAFYTIRLSVEAVLLFAVPYFAISVLNDYFIASVSAGLGLMVPFALLRGSSYELKLDLFKGDPDIETMFAIHYQQLVAGERN